MISMYQWHQVKTMREKGLAIKRIAKGLGISKNTVRKYLRCGEPPTFKTRAHEKKSDSFQEEIKAMIEKGYIGSRIYSEIQRTGYVGSPAGVYRCIRGYRYLKKVQEVSTTRFETAPGQQMQYDWKEWILSVDGKPVKIYLHDVVLSYSRMKSCCFSLSITGQDILRAIESALLFFGGTTSDLVIDNPRALVVAHGKNGVVQYNEAFLRFCGLYRIHPIACRPYRARTKGKVERPFYYFQEHFLRGLSVGSLLEFEQKLSEFTEGYNRRIHSTLGESPADRYRKEKEALAPLCVVEPTSLYSREIRRVSNDGYIAWGGAFYPVPMRLCLQDVWVESVFGRVLRVYEKDGTQIAEQAVSLNDSKSRPVHPEHEGMNQGFQEKKGGVRSALVARFLLLFGEIGPCYLKGLNEKVGANLYWHLSEILDCCKIYDSACVGRALEACIQIGAYHKNSVMRALEPTGVPSLSPEKHSLLREWPRVEMNRPLSMYAGIGQEVCHE